MPIPVRLYLRLMRVSEFLRMQIAPPDKARRDAAATLPPLVGDGVSPGR
jgi:hypothetical protein